MITYPFGMLMTVVVHGADKQDRQVAESVIETLRYSFPRLRKISEDEGYAGQLAETIQKSSDRSWKLLRELLMNLKFFPCDELWREL